jgi:D-glycero-D-manno-heptose 1,7-bisphosphate phosphatase
LGIPAIFLDRDGTLNKDQHFLKRIQDFEWLEGAVEGLRLLTQKGWPVVVVSNQSGLARGYFTEVFLQEVEALMRKDCPEVQWLGFYYCPHHPEFSGECDCRKPKPGLLLAAATQHGIELGQSWMVGDQPRDLQAGLAAGTQVAGVCSGRDAGAHLQSYTQHELFKNLWDFARKIPLCTKI